MKGIDKKYHRKLLTEKFPIKKEDRFSELIDDVEIRIDYAVFKIDENRFPCSTKNFLKGEFLLFEYDLKEDRILCSYSKVWSIFENEYNMDYNEIDLFIRNMIKKHFKIEASTVKFFLIGTNFKINSKIKN